MPAAGGFFDEVRVKFTSQWEPTGYIKMKKDLSHIEGELFSIQSITKKTKDRFRELSAQMRAINKTRVSIGKVAGGIADWRDSVEIMARSGALQKMGVGIKKTGELYSTTSNKGIAGFKDMSKEERVLANETFLMSRMTKLGTKDLRKLSNEFQTGQKTAERFRMELLSVMFFGMAMSRSIKQITQPAMETMGVFDIWRVSMEILFLPVAERVLDLMLWLLDVIDNLTPAGKMFWGVFAGLVGVLGTALFLFGTLGLGIIGVKAAFPKTTLSVVNFTKAIKKKTMALKQSNLNLKKGKKNLTAYGKAAKKGTTSLMGFGKAGLILAGAAIVSSLFMLDPYELEAKLEESFANLETYEGWDRLDSFRHQ